jgi:glycosyltransferase involved in cell wall biosynthesis
MAALAGLALRVRPTRLYLNQAGLARLVLPIARLLGVPLVLHVRLLEDVGRSLSLSGSERAPLHLILVSDAMAELARGEVHTGHVTVSTAYDPYPLSVSPAPLPEVAPFVSVGRLAHGKGMHLLLEALALEALAGTRADIFGVGVDGDDYASRLERYAKKHDLPVRFMGFHSDVRHSLPRYRFLVSTSHYETLGRVVMEGWEAGLVPIVYAGSGGAAEMVRKSGAGILYDIWEAGALASTLETALGMSAEERSKMVDGGRAWMTNNLDLVSYQNALRAVLF